MPDRELPIAVGSASGVRVQVQRAGLLVPAFQNEIRVGPVSPATTFGASVIHPIWGSNWPPLPSPGLQDCVPVEIEPMSMISIPPNQLLTPITTAVV